MLDIVPIAELPPADRDRWAAMQQADRTFESPYFHPGWAEAVNRARGGVLVAVVREGDDVGYWPLEVVGGTAVACGAPLSDYHGCIAPAGLAVDTRILLKRLGVGRLEFDHLLPTQPSLERFADVDECSPYMDLTGGREAYLKSIGKSGRRQVKAIDKKADKLAADVGPVRLEADCRDAAVLERVVAWKSAQYRSTGLPDIFAADWTGRLLGDLLDRRDDGTAFAGRLSALYAGDRLAAAHFGLRAGPVVHWWFPTYDDTLADYSPGWQLLVAMVDQAASEGIDRIDLGKGMSQFKRKAMSGSVPLREGVVEHNAIRRAVRRTARTVKERLKRTPLRTVLHRPASWLFHRNVGRVLNSS